MRFRGPKLGPSLSPGTASLAQRWSSYWAAQLNSVAGLKLWISADNGTYQDLLKTTPAVLDTAPVRILTDQSLNSIDPSAASDAARPILKLAIINGKPILRYDGVNSLLTSTSFLGAGYDKALSYFFVVKSAALKDFKVFLSQGIKWYTCNDVITGGVEGIRYYKSDLATNERYLMISQQLEYKTQVGGFTYDGIKRRCYQAGAYNETTETNNLGVSGALTIGDYSAGGFKAAWDIAEIFVYNAGLSVNDALKVQGYLAWKYNLPLAQRRLIFDGDSLTAGAGATAGNDYPRQLARLLGIGKNHVYNNAIVGQTIDQVSSRCAAIDAAKAAVLTGPKNIFFAWCGTNDIEGGQSGASTYTDYVTFCQARQTAGYKVIAFTILPRGNGSKEAERIAFNNSVKANYLTFADALCDVADDGRIGDNGDQNNTTYYDADTVHLNDTGYGIIALLAKPRVESL